MGKTLDGIAAGLTNNPALLSNFNGTDSDNPYSIVLNRPFDRWADKLAIAEEALSED
jgi:hypothetical protein